MWTDVDADVDSGYAGYTEFLAEMRAAFSSVQTRKPGASRNRSSEIYLLGRNKR